MEEICQVMTMEEAGAIVVPRGPCMGWTMAQVAERRPSSLRFFLTKFCECSNSQKAAATLLMQDNEPEKGRIIPPRRQCSMERSEAYQFVRISPFRSWMWRPFSV